MFSLQHVVLIVSLCVLYDAFVCSVFSATQIVCQMIHSKSVSTDRIKSEGHFTCLLTELGGGGGVEAYRREIN